MISASDRSGLGVSPDHNALNFVRFVDAGSLPVYMVQKNVTNGTRADPGIETSLFRTARSRFLA